MFSIPRNLLLLIAVSQLCLINCASLDLVNDDELMNLIRTEKYVVVLFSKEDCETCDNYEQSLTAIREDLVDALNTWVVKVVHSQMTRLYSPSKEPALVFFRHGVPLLYDGPLKDDLILHTFTSNKEPAVKELTDDTFEHLTQASTGATTGDWFVMFYTNDCIDCQKMQARWEAVGARLKTRMNVARVNRGTTGAATARRFDTFYVPAFILFKQGKMYRYDIHKYDINSFVSFAQEWYKNVTPERVPSPKTPFDDLVSSVADYLKANPWLFQLGFGSLIMGFIGAMLVRYKRATKQSTGGETKSKPKKVGKKEK